MTINDNLFTGLEAQSETVTFVPRREAGLARLQSFASRAGAHYAAHRNYDLGPAQRSTVSVLSPWIRHRLISEEEVLTHTLGRNSPTAAMKFTQEVFWRGYFKGWLQQHPSVWDSYLGGLQAARNALEGDVRKSADYRSAVEGRTGIDCFDHWCRELKEVGYLHNHARMWFASIWIFTLRLPWELGARFFLDHLIDGDPASNTLSWRWVGGLHTKGKTYLARPSNIAKYTNGAFHPIGQLAQIAEPLIEDHVHPLVPFQPTYAPGQTDFLLLVTPEDCQPETCITDRAKGVLGLSLPPEPDQGKQLHAFTEGGVADALARLGGRDKVVTSQNWGDAIVEKALELGVREVRTAFTPVGPVATKLASLKAVLAAQGITLNQQHRSYDAITWPHATKGFFKLKKKIPTILSDLGFANV